jgi:hypothetical protein
MANGIMNGKGKYISLGFTLVVALLILSSGSVNASFLSSIKSAVFSPINQAVVFAPAAGGYGYNVNGTLIVKKVVVGTDWSPSRFTIGVYSAPGNALIKSVPGSTNGIAVSLSGAYNVKEISVPTATINFNTSYSAECSGSLSNGAGATCTVTNTARAPLGAYGERVLATYEGIYQCRTNFVNSGALSGSNVAALDAANSKIQKDFHNITMDPYSGEAHIIITTDGAAWTAAYDALLPLNKNIYPLQATQANCILAAGGS